MIMPREPQHSLPLADKTVARILEGYDEDHFGRNYWLHPDKNGNARIDRDATSIIEYVKMLQFIKAVPEDPLILDIGAGPGRMVKDFRDAGYRCEGCEYSQSGREIAKERFDITLAELDLRTWIPFDTGEFDFAYCVGVLSMIPKANLHTSFFEIARILKPKACVMIMLLNPKPVANEPHLTCLTYDEWRSMAVREGFEDVTSLWAPQRHGIGLNNEWAPLLRKR